MCLKNNRLTIFKDYQDTLIMKFPQLVPYLSLIGSSKVEIGLFGDKSITKDADDPRLKKYIQVDIIYKSGHYHMKNLNQIFNLNIVTGVDVNLIFHCLV